MKHLHFKLIGLTGNIACGKSTVAQFLNKLGFPVIDADQLARNIILEAPILKKVIRAFESSIINQNGSLNRGLLRKIVYSDKKKRLELEALLHPEIQAQSKQLCEEYLKQNKSVVVYDAALLVESGNYKICNGGLLVITCSPTLQKERLLYRDSSLTNDLADQMIRSQMPQHEKIKYATWVIENNETIDKLKEKVLKLKPYLIQK